MRTTPQLFVLLLFLSLSLPATGAYLFNFQHPVCSKTPSKTQLLHFAKAYILAATCETPNFATLLRRRYLAKNVQVRLVGGQKLTGRDAALKFNLAFCEMWKGIKYTTKSEQVVGNFYANDFVGEAAFLKRPVKGSTFVGVKKMRDGKLKVVSVVAAFSIDDFQRK